MYEFYRRPKISGVISVLATFKGKKSGRGERKGEDASGRILIVKAMVVSLHSGKVMYIAPFG